MGNIQGQMAADQPTFGPVPAPPPNLRKIDQLWPTTAITPAVACSQGSKDGPMALPNKRVVSQTAAKPFRRETCVTSH